MFAFTLLQLTVVSKLSSRDLVPSKLDPLLFLRSKTTGQTAEQDRLQIFFVNTPTKNLRKNAYFLLISSHLHIVDFDD